MMTFSSHIVRFSLSNIKNKTTKRRGVAYIRAYSSCLDLQSLPTHYAIMQITEMANLLRNHL